MSTPTTDHDLRLLRNIHHQIPGPSPESVHNARAALRQLIADETPAHPAPTGQHYAAAKTRPSGTRRRRLTLAGGLAAVVALIALATTGIVGQGVDVVSRAQAALTTGGPVVHLVTTGGWTRPDGTLMGTGEVGRGGRRGSLSPRLESWATERPLRYLTKRDLIAADGTVLGTKEDGYAADGSAWETTATGRVIAETPEQTRATAIGGPEGLADNLNNGLGVDPTKKIRALLNSGAFTDAGTTRIDERDARRLVAERRNADGTAVRTEYFIDADTYAPLRIDIYTTAGRGDITTTSPSAAAQAPATSAQLSSRVVVERFERLPLDDRTTALFQVPKNVDAGTLSRPKRK